MVTRGTLLTPDLEVALDPITMALSKERTDFGALVERVPDAKPLGQLGDGVHHFVIAVTRGKDPRVSQARLAVDHERGESQRLHRRSQIGVVQDDRG